MTLTSSNKKRKSEETLPISSTSTSNQNQHQNHKKRKQTNTSPSSPSSSDSSSNSQSIKNQLKQIQIQLNQTKSQLLQSQNDLKSKVELLDSVRSSLRCNICFETFNSPYTLLCGHIFCHKDLYAWFHRLPSDYDTELEFDISDLDDYTNEPRREDRHQGRPIVPTSDRNQPSGNNPPEAPSTNTTDQPPPRVQPPRPSAYRKKKNLICPQCRTAVHTPPFQLYAIKEATDHLRKDEAQVENVVNSESPIRHDPEAHRNEKDLTWGNIFLGTHHLPRPIVHDVEDGVRRCGQCNWEIAADGICEGCGEIYSDVNDSDEGNSDDSDNRWAGQSQQSNSSWTDRSGSHKSSWDKIRTRIR
ncbi:hypothetical protein DFH28DRAFT_154592 [Melampsora americana]|nr:hypothetical protein DFH28DRAFT_154592 [Melampsora americana]